MSVGFDPHVLNEYYLNAEKYENWVFSAYCTYVQGILIKVIPLYGQQQADSKSDN